MQGYVIRRIENGKAVYVCDYDIAGAKITKTTPALDVAMIFNKNDKALEKLAADAKNTLVYVSRSTVELKVIRAIKEKGM